jgi:RNA-directed DNA polymerase
MKRSLTNSSQLLELWKSNPSPDVSNTDWDSIKVKGIFHSYPGVQTSTLTSKMNPLIRGWGNYFRAFSSRKTFELLDSYIYQKCSRFGYRRHPNKGKKWVVEKYFSMRDLSYPNDNWVFGCHETKTFMLA